MSKVIADYNDIKNIADAIRTKTNTTEEMALTDIPNKIYSISGGSSEIIFTSDGNGNITLSGVTIINNSGNAVLT